MIRAGLPVVTPEELDAVLSREDALTRSSTDKQIVEKLGMTIFSRWLRQRLFILINDLVEAHPPS